MRKKLIRNIIINYLYLVSVFLLAVFAILIILHANKKEENEKQSFYNNETINERIEFVKRYNDSLWHIQTTLMLDNNWNQLQANVREKELELDFLKGILTYDEYSTLSKAEFKIAYKKQANNITKRLYISDFLEKPTYNTPKKYKTIRTIFWVVLISTLLFISHPYEKLRLSYEEYHQKFPSFKRALRDNHLWTEVTAQKDLNATERYFIHKVDQNRLCKKEYQPTSKTPYVLLDPTGIIEIKGRGIPEDVSCFFDGINTWIMRYNSSPAKFTEVSIELEYTNDGFAKYLLRVLRLLKDIANSESELKINWIYEEGDDDIYELGEIFSSSLSYPIHFVEI